MTKRDRVVRLRAKWFAAGLVAQVGLLLAPLHEAGHAIAALVSGAYIVSFSWAEMTPSFISPFILSGGVLLELLVYGGISILAVKHGRLGFFCSGAFWGVALTWWISGDRSMLVGNFGGVVFFWDAVLVILGSLLYYTRRYCMWVCNPRMMALLAGREGICRKKERGSHPSNNTTGCGGLVQA